MNLLSNVVARKKRPVRKWTPMPEMRMIDVRPNIGSLSFGVPIQFKKEGMTAVAVELHRVGY